MKPSEDGVTDNTQKVRMYRRTMHVHLLIPRPIDTKYFPSGLNATACTPDCTHSELSKPYNNNNNNNHTTPAAGKTTTTKKVSAARTAPTRWCGHVEGKESGRGGGCREPTRSPVAVSQRQREGSTTKSSSLLWELLTAPPLMRLGDALLADTSVLRARGRRQEACESMQTRRRA